MIDVILGVICGQFVQIESVDIAGHSGTISASVETRSNIASRVEEKSDSYIFIGKNRDRTIILKNSIATNLTNGFGKLNTIELVSEEVETFL